VYYIASDGNAYIVDSKTNEEYAYNASTPELNYYLVPASDPVQNDWKDAYYDGTTGNKPFLTTYKVGQEDTPNWSEAVWVVRQVTDNDGTFYYIMHAETGKYVIYQPLFTGGDSRRKCMHLDETSPKEACKFVIEEYETGVYDIVPKSMRNNQNTSNKFWNIADRNRNSRRGLDASKYYGGLVGLYSYNGSTKLLDVNSRWKFEKAVPKVSSTADDKVELASPVTSATTKIHYTTDGSNPTVSSAEYTNTTNLTLPTEGNMVVKVIAVVSDGVTPTPNTTSSAIVTMLYKPDVTLSQDTYIYNGGENKPTVSAVSIGTTTADANAYSSPTYSEDVTNVGTPTVTITDADESDFWYIWNASTTFTINPAEVTLTANSGTVPYDGTEKTVTGFTSSLDGLTFEGVTASGSGTNIGEYDVTFTGVTIGTTKDTSGNYVVTETINGTLTITPKPLTITADSDTKVYDGTPLTKDSYTNTALLIGDQIESVTVTGSQTNAGISNNVPSAAVIKNSTDDDVTANYEITYTNGTLEVTKKPLTIMADIKLKAYGEDDPALTYTSEGLINDDVITGSLTREAGEDVGTYAIYQGGVTAGTNYAITYIGANLTINKKGLTVTAANNTITYGDAPAANGVTFEGFVNSETASVLGGTLDYDYSYTQYGDVGSTYTITPKGLISTNYDITFAAGTLTVNAKEVGIGWTDTEFTYNGEEQMPMATATGLVNNDEVGITVTGAQTNAGNYTATASALTGVKKGNYLLPAANTQSFTISPKSIGTGTLADGYTLGFGEGNSILLTDDVIGCSLVASTDYNVGEDQDDNDKYSERTVTGTGNYTGSFDVRNVVVSFATDSSQEEWSATFSAEKADESDIGLTLPEGVNAFIISDIEGEWAIPEPLNYIPEGVPVLLVAHQQINGFVATKANSEDVTLITDAQKEKNMLKEVTESTPGYDAVTESAPFETRQIYLLYKNEFVFNKAGNMKKGKVYLNPNHTVTSPNPAPARLQIAWNHTTGIKDGRWKMEDGRSERWYTIDGRQLNGKPDAKGLYIVGGKKIVVK
jgi:hypothetical protein